MWGSLRVCAVASGSGSLGLCGCLSSLALSPASLSLITWRTIRCSDVRRFAASRSHPFGFLPYPLGEVRHLVLLPRTAIYHGFRSRGSHVVRLNCLGEVLLCNYLPYPSPRLTHSLSRRVGGRKKKGQAVLPAPRRMIGCRLVRPARLGSGLLRTCCRSGLCRLRQVIIPLGLPVLRLKAESFDQ